MSTREAVLEEERPAGAPAGKPSTISLGALAWLTATAAFLLLRLGVTWQAPVGGAELTHLAGAWQAAAGVDDHRFIPTIFQALTAVTFLFTNSEVPARIIAFGATATIPAATYALRRPFGEAGALFALFMLALDPAGIWLGVAASASAFDLAVTLWLLVVIDRRPRRPLPWAAAAFFVAGSGPLSLALAAAAIGASVGRGRRFRRDGTYAAAAGATIAVAAASFGFGFGPASVTVPPFGVLADSFEQTWSTATAWEATAVYGWPLLAFGTAGVALHLQERARGLSTTHLTTLAWFGLGLAWLAAGGGSHSILALTAATTPAAFLGGRFLSWALSQALRGAWAYARVLLPAATLALLVASTVVARWARAGDVPGNGEVLVVVLLVSGAVGTVVALAAQPGSRRVVPAAAAAVALLPLITGAFGVGLSGAAEPVPSPAVSPQARVLRDVVLQLAAERGGAIVVHPQLVEDLTWPFRDTGTLLAADRVPAGTAVVIWPASQPQPEGVVPLAGQWAVLRVVEPPTGGFLRYFNWFADRNGVVIRNVPISVYTVAIE